MNQNNRKLKKQISLQASKERKKQLRKVRTEKENELQKNSKSLHKNYLSGSQLIIASDEEFKSNDLDIPNNLSIFNHRNDNAAGFKVQPKKKKIFKEYYYKEKKDLIPQEESGAGFGRDEVGQIDQIELLKAEVTLISDRRKAKNCARKRK